MIHGHHNLAGWLSGLNCLGGSKNGKCELKFKDNTVYKFENPEMAIEHMLEKKKVHVYYKTAYIKDLTNNLTAEITFNPNFNLSAGGALYRNTIGWLPGMNGLGKNKTTKRTARADDIDIKIKVLMEDGAGAIGD